MDFRIAAAEHYCRSFVPMENARRDSGKKSTARPSVISLEAGKLPPQAVDFEQAVLGAMMIDRRAVDKAINILQDNTDVFYKPEHREIYRSVINLYNNTQPIDLLTVSNDLKMRGELDGAGGDFYLVQLTQKVSSAANIEFHARIVQQKFFQRELIALSSDLINKSYDDSTDVFDLLDEAESGIFNITNSNIKKSYEKADDLVQQAIKRIEELSKQEGGISGLPSGFRDVDKVTAGWQASDLIVIAARPGMGKTAFIVSMAKNMAIKHQVPVALFSLEMSSVQLITRMISSETGITSNKLREGSLQQYEWDILYQKVKDLEKAPIYIDETPGLSLLEFRAKARRLVSQGVKIIFIDYLQLMTVGQSQKVGNREQEISTISRTLKAMAKELKIPIIALSQLSRGVEAQTGQSNHKRPMLQHLRESGAIEQDADIVSFIYRPEYYNFDTWEDGSPTANQAEFIIAKHRNGDLKNIRLAFIGNLAQFRDLDEVPQAAQGFAIEDSYESSINSLSTSPQSGTTGGFDPRALPTDAFDSSINRNIPPAGPMPTQDDDEMPF